MDDVHRSTALIGADLGIIGDIKTGGTVEVHGLVHGSLSAARVVVHPGGRVLGTLKADSAEIQGLLQGNVAVRQLLSIGGSGVVRGDVRYGRIAMAAGAELDAAVRNIPPGIVGDFDIVVRRGRSVAITVSDISAVDPDDAAADLAFTVSRPVNGHVARASAPRSAIEHFTQAELLAGGIVFAHDGASASEAGFEVVVADAAGATSGAPRAVHVTVV